MNSPPLKVELLLQDAELIAKTYKHPYLGVEHVFLAAMKAGLLDDLLKQTHLSEEQVEEKLRGFLIQGEATDFPKSLPRTPRLKKILDRATDIALKKGERELLPTHLFESIFMEENGLVALALSHFQTSHKETPQQAVTSKKEKKTSLLDRMGRDLTQMAKDKKLEPVIGRKEELRRLMQILTRKTKNVPILIGQPGVGKTAVVYAFAQRLAEGTVPQALQEKRVIEMPLSAIMAGTAHRGELEERVQKILEELSENPDCILFIDEIHGITGGKSGKGGLDLGDLLKAPLADGSIKVIGATTTEEYQKYLLKDAALERRFQPVLVAEPSEEETMQILEGLRARYESYHGVTFEPDALEQAIKLSVRYLPDRHLPDKALDLLDEAASRVKIKTQVSSPATVSGRELAEVVSMWTGIPAHRLSGDEKQKLLHLESALKTKIIGQDHAIEKISETIRVSRAGLGNPKRPIGVFLFLGPTGVGKTELAKALADNLFGSPEEVIRLDMSEYKEPHSVAKLIGAPPGYVGYDEEGQLTKAVHAKPYSLILFDEIEKAHVEVLDLFLQIFDDGRLTDSKGRTVHFTHSLIIMTSNLGSHHIFQGLEKQLDAAEINQQIMTDVKNYFRPEFLNRLDEIVLFNPLSQASLEQIIDIQLKELEQRLAEQKLKLIASPSLKEFLKEKGYDPTYGARPLRRAIQQYVAKPLSQGILDGQFSEGNTVIGEVLNGHVTFKVGGIS